MKTKFTINEIRPRLFLLEFPHSYDMCMFFLRYQEFYESSSPKFRGKKFELLDFMRWYSLTLGDGAFTYPADWSGFNLPSHIIKQVHDLYISDKNTYDYEMWEVYKQCCDKVGDKFYLIGMSLDKGRDSTLDHEMAHGFFYLHAQYKKDMTKLVKQMDPELRQHMERFLKTRGYARQVYTDEIQAYMASENSFDGTQHFTNKVAKQLTAAQAPFRQLFEKQYKWVEVFGSEYQ